MAGLLGIGIKWRSLSSTVANWKSDMGQIILFVDAEELKLNPFICF
ncbi:MAG: hypothetical protein M1526_06100 [Candidatus Thermoplasmatota archaeon]|nr:hypothetical protein [Candidatus Thermoplasmatota archaeon]